LLSRRYDSHRCQPHQRKRWFAHEDQWRKQDVPNDVPVLLGNEGNDWCGVLSQGIDKVRFYARFERDKVDCADTFCINRTFFSNVHGSPLW
jgi:hypothetical protein